MSESDAKTPEVVKVVGIFASLGVTRKVDLGKEMEVKEGSEVKESEAAEVASSSKLEKKVPEADADGDKDRDEPTSSIQSLVDPEVNLNEDVIGEIGKFLNLKDLKSLRRVDTLWSAGVTSTFVQKSAIVLRSGQKRAEELEAFEKDTKDLNGPTVLKIKIAEGFRFEQEPQRFNDILANLSPNLTSLELEGWSNKTNLFLPRASIQLPALTSLTIRGIGYDYMDKEIKQRLFQLLFASAPDLVELVVCRLDSAVLFPLLADDGSRNLSLAPKLKWLRIPKYISSEELSTIVHFPQSWESLELSVRRRTRFDDTFELLGQLLEANRDSLVRLSLEMETERGQRGPQTLRFPNTFSKLVKLQLQFWDRGSLLNFENGFVNYYKIFPKLTSLCLTACHDPDLRMLGRIWSYFFSPQIFRGLKYLELKTLGVYPRFLRNEGIAEDWTERMFPNAKIEIN